MKSKYNIPFSSNQRHQPPTSKLHSQEALWLRPASKLSSKSLKLSYGRQIFHPFLSSSHFPSIRHNFDALFSFSPYNYWFIIDPYSRVLLQNSFTAAGCPFLFKVVSGNLILVASSLIWVKQLVVCSGPYFGLLLCKDRLFC